MKKLLCILLCLLTLALCACLPTPEEEYVVNKGDDLAEDKINSTALPVVSPDPAETGEPSPWKDSAGQAVFPERWEDNIRTDYKEMMISADVVTSGMKSYPVQLVRKRDFTSDETARMAGYLFRNETVTGWRSGTSPSREYLMEAMRLVTDSDMSEKEKAELLEELDHALSVTSVTDADVTPCKSLDEIPLSGIGVTVFTESGGGMLHLLNGVFEASTTGLNAPPRIKSGWAPNDPDTPEFSAEISLEEAEAEAEAFFTAMELEGFELYFSDEAICINDYTREVRSTGWELRFIRSFGYVPFSVSQYDDSNMFDLVDDAAEFSEPVREETVWLYVTGSGIGRIRFSNPYELVATVNENVQLYDFNELTSRIKLLFTAAINSPYQSEGYYVLEDMILTVVPQLKKDSADYYMVPVWVCRIGEYVSLGDGLGVSHFYIPGEQAFDGWLTVAFNAIDGTRVSLPQG